MNTSVYLAVDLGATSGRVMAGIVREEGIRLEQVNRFETKGLQVNGSWHWDVKHIFGHVVDGLTRAANLYGSQVGGIGVDTWGVDYGLLDETGKLLVDPFMYRDSRTDGVEERLQQIVSKETIYNETGIQFIFFNSINQLFAEIDSEEDRLQVASDLLFMPDLFSYWLCGEKIQERSIASTSQLLNPINGKWSEVLIESLGFPKRLFRELTESGTRIGSLLPDLQRKTGLGAVTVFAVTGHDTGSAVAAAPLRDDAPAFLSSGTWSLMGIETQQARVNPETLAFGYSNEAGAEGSTRLLKNICGMWLVEQLKQEWLLEGDDLSYAELVMLASVDQPLRSIVDPDDPAFAKPGPMARRIRDFCRDHGEPIPEYRGQLLRTVFDSLACKYRIVFDQLANFTSKPLRELRVVGGGSQNDFLNQCIANALNCQVHAGPVEAASLGNILMQLRGAGRIDSLDAGRELVARSFEPQSFLPLDPESWEPPVERLRRMISTEPGS